MIEAALSIVSGLVKAWNNWRAERHDENVANTARTVQVAENLKTTVETSNHDQKNAEDVRRLSDADLDAELRGDQRSPSATGH